MPDGVAPVPGHVAPLPGRVAPMPGRVTTHTRALVHRVAILCCAQDRAVSQPFWSYHASPASYRGACSSVSQRCCTPCRSLSCDTPSSQAALLSRYAHLYCDTPHNGQAMSACAAHPMRRPIVSSLMSCAQACLPSLVSRYNSLYCDLAHANGQ